MPVTVDLIHDGYVLHYVFTDPWTIEDLLRAYDQERRFRDAAGHTVHGYIDFTAARRIPRNWLQARHGPGLNHPTSGELICVGLNRSLKIILEVVLRLTNFTRIRLFDTPEEAEPYLVELVAQTKAEAPATG